jgi:transposase
MLSITSHHRIFLAVKHIDFRHGLDSLKALCQRVLGEDPFSGYCFVFTNRAKTAVKIIIYDGIGFWFIVRRFSKGHLGFWPTSENSSVILSATQLQILLNQGTPESVHFQEPFALLKSSGSFDHF